MVLALDIHAYWFYNRENNANITTGRQVISLLNPEVVKGKGRLKGTLGRKEVVIIAMPAKVEFSSTAGTRGRGSGRGRGRGRGASHKAGHGISSTRRHLSAFEIDPHEFPPISIAPARL